MKRYTKKNSATCILLSTETHNRPQEQLLDPHCWAKPGFPITVSMRPTGYGVSSTSWRTYHISAIVQHFNGFSFDVLAFHCHN